MAISRKIDSEEDLVRNLINKGGSVPNDKNNTDIPIPKVIATKNNNMIGVLHDACKLDDPAIPPVVPRRRLINGAAVPPPLLIPITPLDVPTAPRFICK